MTEKVIYFDICAVVMFAMMLFSVFFRKMVKGKTNQYYALMLIVAAVSAVFDLLAVGADNHATMGYVGLKQFLHTGYIIFHNLSTPAYIVYIVTLTDTTFRIRQNKLLMYAAGLPFILVVLASVINLFNGKLFYFDEMERYTRGEWFPLLYISAFFYVSFGWYHIIRYKKLFSGPKYIMLMAVIPMMVIAVIFQIFFPQYIVESFASALGMLSVSMVIQRPEEFIDVNTETENFNAYADDMKRAFKNRKPMDVILVNTANFSSLNEILGYDDGNSMLKSIGEKITEINRQMKTNAEIYHLDRGRFRVVLDRSCGNNVIEIASAINDEMKKVIYINHMEINLVEYVCIVRCPEDIDDFDTIIEFGKDLHTKYEYTGQVLHASEIIQKKRYNVMHELDAIIERAMVNGNFSVYYQPIYSVEEGCFRSAEALLRLNDDKYGFVSPELFIPAAEKSGVINKIGEYVIEEVCRFISGSEFGKLGLNYIEVNLSVVQCMQNGLAERIMDILKRFGVSPDKINLEITETAADYNQNIMAENLYKLSAAGIEFSLDDFGTGYSNMKRMAMLPLKIVKLDKTFVDTDDNPKMMIVLQNTIKMLKAMDMEIVVEGIETESRAKQFSDLKCEYIQGYYYSKPVPENEFVEFIKSYSEQNCSANLND